MSLHHVNMISNRLSLRKPQRDSLEILQRICEITTLGKASDIKQQLDLIKSEFSNVKAFDRDFISLCFALATGVGKTRLMGAFISYLFLSEKIRHFFVLAPNLTIYNKLIADFTPNTPKYVFKGIGEFAQNPPLIITGDNYDSGIGIREGYLFQHMTDEIHINIFNISKITAKDKGKLAADDANKNVPRIRRLSEFIGESYFDYLAGLDDLVVIMDESHRYRADAGMSAINELKPIIGLELTATPQVEQGNRTEKFNNVIYSYPLSAAMNDGFVKEPAVATRENFIPANYSSDSLEKLKLEDGIRIHENTKVELEIYARNNEQTIVKPFMLVVAQDTDHANNLKVFLESKEFFESRYAGKVITVHSKNTKGNEGDDIVQQLLTVEDYKNPIEIVIHVNMLKEGWDVTNLYTIVPLRAANSKTLVEQSIGRGLRLPYGKRTGIASVDRLTIVSHDKFQEIIDHANDSDSIIRAGVIIGRDIPEQGKRAVIVESAFQNAISGNAFFQQKDKQSVSGQNNLFKGQEVQKVARVTFDVIQKYENLKGSHELQKPEIQKEIVERVKEIVTPLQGTFDLGDNIDIIDVVKTTTVLYRQLSIDIPKIVVLPKGEVTCGYKEFLLNLSNVHLQPVSQEILIQHLRDRQRYTMQSVNPMVHEKRLEDYIVRGLIDFDDVNYDEYASVLYNLASQVVNHLKSYLFKEEDIINVLQYHQTTLVNLVYAQMQKNFVVKSTDYEVNITKGFRTLRSNNYSAAANENTRDYHIAISEGERNQIKTMIFGGFQKCLYPVQKFDSDTERRFAVILENDKTVEKWFKPAKGDFQIHYTSTESYEPDFVVETLNAKYLCEPKRNSEMSDEIVLTKAKAAVIWCKHASEHAKETDNKQWKYLLIPHDQITEQKTLSGLVATYTF
ncbi:MAG: DEAD/DEAH box helicase family protein [Lentisphaerota bacterium]